MLSRAALSQSLEAGRRLVEDLDQCVAEHRRLRGQEDDAFSLGNLVKSQRLRDERQALEERTAALRSQLSVLLAQLSDEMLQAVREHEDETGLVPTLPEGCPTPATPDRLEECRSYFEHVEATLTGVSSQLLAFRRSQLRPQIEALETSLQRLSLLNRPIPAVKEYLDGEAWLDLSLTSARNRLAEEQMVVSLQLEDAEREERERARRQRLANGHAALKALLDISDEKVTEKALAAAAVLLQEGSEEDRLAYWNGLFEKIASVPQHVAALLLPAFDRPLRDYFASPDPSASLEFCRTATPERLEVVDRLLSSAASLVSEHFEEAPDLPVSVARLIDIKSVLPAASFRLLSALDAKSQLPMGLVASWMLAPPLGWSGALSTNEWAAIRCEQQELWREAYAFWRIVPTPQAQERAFICSMIALAQTETLVPGSIDDWQALIERYRYLSETTRVVTAATWTAFARLLGGAAPERLGPPPVLPLEEGALRDTITLFAKAHPEPLDRALLKSEEHRRDCSRLRKELKEKLERPRKHAGHASLEFARDVLFPELRRTWATSGTRGIAALEPNIVDRLLREHGRQINPVAVQAIKREDIQGLASLASRLLTAEGTLNSSDPPSVQDLRSSLSHECATRAYDPPTRWAYAHVASLLSPSPPPSTVAPFDRSQLARALFPLNPWLECSPGPDTAESLYRAALEELSHLDSVHRWRVRGALAQRCFTFARRCAAEAPEPERSALVTTVEKAYSEEAATLQSDLELIQSSLGLLRPSDEVELVTLSLEEARASLSDGDLLAASRVLTTAFDDYTRVERLQQDELERAVSRGESVVASVLRSLWTRRFPQSNTLVALISTIAQMGYDKGPLHVDSLLTATEELLAGRTPDAILPALAPWSLLQPGPQDLTVGETVDRAPVSLDALPYLVQRELEVNTSAAGPDDADDLWLRVMRQGPLAHTALPALQVFTARYRGQGDWEAPLLWYLQVRGRSFVKEGQYLRAAEYFLAGLQVAYAAAGRLPDGLEASRQAAFAYATARLALLRTATGRQVELQAFLHRPGPAQWTALHRDFLLLRAAVDLADTISVMLNVAPGLAGDFLDLPIAELPQLRPQICRSLLDRIEACSSADLALLAVVGSQTSNAADRDITMEYLIRLRDTRKRVAEGRVDEENLVSLTDEIATLLELTPIHEGARDVFADAFRQVTTSGLTLDLTATELTFAALTREICADVPDGESEIPVHLRVTVKPGAPAIRDVIIGFRCTHPMFELADRSRQLSLPWLRSGAEAQELTCWLQTVRPKGVEPAPSSELILEVAEVGLRKGGQTKASLPYRGRELPVRVVPKYRYEHHLNPYSPGPAVRDLRLIRGRREETREVLRKLRGEFQDNVPLVYGPRRIGKSTLLYRVKLDPEVRRFYEPVICDMEGIVRSKDNTVQFAARLARTICSELKGTRAGRVPCPPFADNSQPLDVLQAYLEQLADACGDRALLLLFDEMEFLFDALTEAQRHPDYGDYTRALHEDIIHTLRHNMQHGRVSFVIAGTHRLKAIAGRIGERLFQLPVPIEIGELDETAANELLLEPVEDVFGYSRRARERILWLTGRHPYLLQGVCHELFSYMQDRRLSLCSLTELDAVLDSRILPQAGYFDFQVKPLLRSPIRRSVGKALGELTSEEKRSDIAALEGRLQLRGTPLSQQHVSEVLRELEEEGVVQRWQGQYRFRFPLVALYVAKELPV